MLTSVELAIAWVTSKRDTDAGASFAEYALLVAVIALVCLAAMRL